MNIPLLKNLRFLDERIPVVPTVLALVKLGLHLSVIDRYDYFIDEFYYIAYEKLPGTRPASTRKACARKNAAALRGHVRLAANRSRRRPGKGASDAGGEEVRGRTGRELRLRGRDRLF